MYPNKSRGAETGRTGEEYSILWELSRSLFDDALVTYDDEREAAFVASARLLCLLERQGDGEPRRQEQRDEA
jgi:hypothetical protein